MKIRTAFSAVAVSAALMLTACGGDDSDNDTNGNGDSNGDDTQSEVTEEPTVDEDGNALPGSELAIGDWAQVPFSSGDFEGTIRLRLVSVEEASLDDPDYEALSESTLERVEGSTPYYFTVEVEKVDGNDLAHQSISTSLRVTDAEGERVQEFSIIGAFEPCRNASFPRDIDEDDDYTHVTCLIGLEMPGAEVPAGLAFGPRDTDYAHFDGEPVLWR